ncbi:MAG TPA: hypothetical protein VGE63_00330 [Candidatus Paceibacterota bacterium]
MNKNLLVILIIALFGGAIYFVQRSGVINLGELSAEDSNTLIQEIQDRSSAISLMLSSVQAIKMDTTFLQSPEFQALIPLNAVILLPSNLGRENPFLEMAGSAKTTTTTTKTN